MADSGDKKTIGRDEYQSPRRLEIYGLGGHRRRLEVKRRRASRRGSKS